MQWERIIDDIDSFLSDWDLVLLSLRLNQTIVLKTTVRVVFVILTQLKELLHVAGVNQELSLQRPPARLVMSILTQGSLRTALMSSFF